MARLYDTDFPAWAEETAQLLAQRRFEEIDLDALIDEVADLSRREKKAVISQLRTLIEHLLNLAFAPAAIRHNNRRLWTNTVGCIRRELGEDLAESRVLNQHAAAQLSQAYSVALATTIGECDDFGPVEWPTTCPWRLEQILDTEFWPEWPG